MNKKNLISDLIIPFRLEKLGIRGRLFNLNSTITEIINTHNYHKFVSSLLIQQLALASVFSSLLKIDGTFTLQVKGDGPINLLLSEIDSKGNLRGYAKYDKNKIIEYEKLNLDITKPSIDLIGSGTFIWSVDQGPNTEVYQGIVPIEGGTLAECAENYFFKSEQLLTLIKVDLDYYRSKNEDQWNIAGILLQSIPEHSKGFAYNVNEKFFKDEWSKLNLYLSTIKKKELFNSLISPKDFLYKIFWEDKVWIYSSIFLNSLCRCSSNKIINFIKSLPKDKIDNIRDENGKVVVRCEYCKKEYLID
ncbi:Hsp33 family molecular chaperone HslO [Alphaproteobacteria bacterium]|nr:Hsp33 family molecular chaperone HslO [Alphaproteobacteria bacterium]